MTMMTPTTPHHDTIEPQRTHLEAEITRVRRKEEKRLIAAADKAGFFDVRIPSTHIIRMIEAEKASISFNRSTLTHLKRRLTCLRQSRRKMDTRRKIILGSFVVAQCRHKPDVHEDIARAIKEDLSHHPNQNRARQNLEFLADFLDDPHTLSDPSPPTPDDLVKDRTHRLVLLGTWLLNRHTHHPTLSELIQTELDGFLAADPRTDVDQAWLVDVLQSQPA